MPKMPGWLPDWRDPTQYPDGKSTPGRRWAWEFLRRNPRYQELWEELVAPYFDTESGCYRLGEENAEGSGETPVQSPDPFTIFRETFGIIGFHPPSYADVSLKFHRDAVIEWRGPSPPRPRNGSYPLSKNHTAIVVDLAELTDAKLNELGKYLKERAEQRGVRPAKTSNHKAKFQKYLRILDAELCGMSLCQIANALFTDIRNDYPERARENAARHALKAAKQLRDDGYRWID